jgi:hypothetical protein
MRLVGAVMLGPVARRHAANPGLVKQEQEALKAVGGATGACSESVLHAVRRLQQLAVTLGYDDPPGWLKRAGAVIWARFLYSLQLHCCCLSSTRV